MVESEESSIERLKRTLYSRNENLVPKEKRTPVSPHESDVPTDWGDKPDFAISPDVVMKKNNSFFNRFLLGSLVFFIISIGIASFIFLDGINMISSNNLTVEVVAPTSVSSGEELSVGLTIVNGNRTDLEDVSLFVTYPDGAYSVTEEDRPIVHDEVKLGIIQKGDRMEYVVRTILFGEKDTVKSFNFRIEYKVKGSNATFSKEKVYDVIMGSSPILLEVKYPKEVNSNQEITISLDITSNSSVPIKDTLVKVEYPYGFTYKSSNIKPVRDNSVWSIGDLKNGDKKTIDIVGTLLGQNLEDRSFRISAGTKTGDVYDFDTTLVSTTITMGIRKSFFDLSIVPNNNESLPGTSITTYVKWQNTLPDKVFDSHIEVVVSGNALDRSKVFAGSGGFYRSLDDTVLWDKNSTDSLIEMSPGESGEVSLSVSSLQNLVQPKLIKNPNINLKVNMTGERSGRDGGTISSTENITIKILPVMNLSAKTFRSVGPFSNIGAIPPKADKETTYTVNWLLTNTTSDLKDTTVRAELPQGVSWKGEVSPASERVTYNPSTRIVSWEVGNVSAGSGFISSAKQIYFKVGLIPSISQVGSAPELTSAVDASATDTYTEKQIKSNALPTTTRFSDPSFASGQDQVVN
ncbi:MAG: Uncharacterized protein CEO12_336 [Parcubacteria group bacterium Gr01-1014_46]|nr:MAG: Uncharacterized protein CEO12_336 [Parcubacteria group bacterium Gr01-1014_46]